MSSRILRLAKSRCNVGARVRSQYHPITVGYVDHYQDSGATYVGRVNDDPVNDYFVVTGDVTGSRELDNPFNSEKFRARIDRVNGTADGMFGFKAIYSNSSPDDFAYYNPAHISTLAYPLSDGELATQVLARTNPNKYYVNGPVSFFELRELPQMVREAGHSILKNPAGHYLSWQFGWKPLIADVKKLLDFNSLVNKKVGQLKALGEEGGLHRKFVFGNVSDTVAENIHFLSFFGVDCYSNFRRKTTIEKWGTVRYKPRYLGLPKDDANLRRLAKQIVYGAELSPSNIWEAIPWSWLVDWFSNVGDYLSTFNNVVPCDHSTPCIMTRTTTVATFARTDSTSAISGGNGTYTYQTKVRSVVGPTLNASVPFLTDRQLSILGSLAVVRASGRRR